MAQEKEITRSDMTKGIVISIMQIPRIKWTVKNISNIEYAKKVFSPEFDLTPECVGCLYFVICINYIYVCLCIKSDIKIQMERTIVFYDDNNKKLHEERDDKIFSLEKDEDGSKLVTVNSNKLNALPNSSLIIDLCVNIKNVMGMKINRLICETDPKRKLSEDLKAMQENPVYSDVSLQVGNERIPAQWSILCSRSPYFKRMFDSGMRERVQNSVTITDSSLGTVKKLIQFLYTADYVDENDTQELFDLYYAADKYEVMDLRHLCACKIMNNVKADNVSEILQLAHQHNDKDLKMEAIDFIRSHSDAVFQTEGWKSFEACEPLAAEFCSFLCMKKN